MFNRKEVVWTLVFILIMFFIVSFSEKPDFSLILLAICAIIILVNLIAKKIAAKYFYIKIEYEPWGWQRWGWYERSHFRKPLPVGLILPFFLSLFSIGVLRMFTFFQFTPENLKTRVLKRRGLIRREEMNESDIGFTAAWGFLALLLLAIIGAIFKQPLLTKYAVYYGIWNLLPLGNLDGGRLFYGSSFTWILITAVYIISLIAVLL